MCTIFRSIALYTVTYIYYIPLWSYRATKSSN